MQGLKTLWRDESGAVLSTELVLVGTLGAVGATVGMNALATSVNEEMYDLARAIRSLDQSYEVRGVQGCGAWTAGSAFHQEPVEESLRRLELAFDGDAAVEERREEPREPELKRPAPIAPPQTVPPSKKKPKATEEEVVL